jgi:RNA polymerase sigma-70 factor, ECF subfamily
LEETTLIQQLKQGHQSALEKIIDIYAAYVNTVVRNVIGTYMKAEDIEEVVSDAFVLLWKQAAQIRENSTTLKSYLAAMQEIRLSRSCEAITHSYMRLTMIFCDIGLFQ